MRPDLAAVIVLAVADAEFAELHVDVDGREAADFAAPPAGVVGEERHVPEIVGKCSDNGVKRGTREES